MSWPLGKVSDIGEVISGFAFKSEWFGAGNAKVIRIGDLHDGRVDLAGAETFDESAHQVREQFKIRNGDILMALSGATVGKIAVADTSINGAYLNQRVAVVRGKCPTNTEYLKYVFSGSLLQKLLTNAGGAAQPNLSPKDLGDMEIPLPPLEEQKRIAAILDKADSIRRKRQQAIKLADDFLRSVFLEMFGDPVTNPKGLPIASIGNLCSVATGSTPSRQVEEYYGGNIPWVKTTEVDGYVIYETEECISDSGLKNSNCKLNPIGSIVLAMYGQGKTRGKVGVLGVEAATNQACAVIKPSSKVMMEYLYIYLQLSYESLRSLGQGAGQPNLNLSIVKNFPVLLPNENEQRKFVKISEAIKNLKQKSVSAVDRSADSFQSLSQKAFSGQL